MRATSINVSYYKTVEAITQAIHSIENDSANYHGDWLRGGPDITLKEGAKKKLAALHKNLNQT